MLSCQWGLWDAWSDCQHLARIHANCGGGYRTSSRKIEQKEQFGGKKCALAATQRSEKCNDRPCPGRYACKKLRIPCIIKF